MTDMSKKAASPPSMIDREARPYPASWLNRMIDWIDSRPGPGWAYYLAGIILLGLLTLFGLWLSTGLPAGISALGALTYAPYPFYFIALMHYLDRQARIALRMFRPSLQISDAEYNRIEYELVTVPAKGGWIVTVIAVVLGTTATLSMEGVSSLQSGELIATFIVGLITTITIASFLILAYHTFRQLRNVSRIHASAPSVSLFQTAPLYAFSQLTSRTGIGLLVFASYSNLADPPSATQPVSIILTGAMLTVAAAAFILPLLGMHNRLVLEKLRLVSEVNRGVEAVYQELQQQVESRNFADADNLNKTFNSLLSLRDTVNRLSTWPWQAETLRTFVSALLLPVLIWIITRILDQVLRF
jgi:hypothetical protein